MKKILSLALAELIIITSLTSCVDVEESYEKLDAFIKGKGQEECLLGQSESGGAKYTRIAKRTDAQIELTVNVTEGDATLRSFSLILTKGALASYKWSFTSSVLGADMSGFIKPDEYVKAALSLDYASTSSTDNYYEAPSMAEHAKRLCNYLLSSLEADLKSIELSAYDFGFEEFEPSAD